MYEIAPGFLLNLIVAVVISLAGKPSDGVETEYDQAVVELKK